MKKNMLIDVTAVGWFGVHNDWPLGTMKFWGLISGFLHAKFMLNLLNSVSSLSLLFLLPGQGTLSYVSQIPVICLYFSISFVFSGTSL